MDILQFTGILRQKLLDQGIDEKSADSYIAEFKQYFEDKSPEEVSQELEKFGSIDRLAKRIKIITDKNISENEEKQKDDPQLNISEKPEPEIPPQSPKQNEDDDDFWDDLDSHDTPDNIASAADNNVRKENVPAQNEKTASESDADHNPELDDFDALYQDNVSTEMTAKEEGKSPDSYTGIENNEYAAKRKKFYWILAACSPVLAIAIMTIVAVFVALYFILAVMIICSVAVLVGIVAAGTLLAVFGMIFGIVKFLSIPSIGLYECGLSIMIGSAAMFAGILVYNFAVRLVPYAGKMLWSLAKLLVAQIKRLYIYTKKEFIGI